LIQNYWNFFHCNHKHRAVVKIMLHSDTWGLSLSALITVNLDHERRRARLELGIEDTFAMQITRHDRRSSLNRSPFPRITRARISRVLLIILSAKISRSHHPKLSPVNGCGPYKLREDEVFSWFLCVVEVSSAWRRCKTIDKVERKQAYVCAWPLLAHGCVWPFSTNSFVSYRYPDLLVASWDTCAQTLLPGTWWRICRVSAVINFLILKRVLSATRHYWRM